MIIGTEMIFTMGLFLGLGLMFVIKRLFDIITNSLWPISVSIGMQRGNSIVWDKNERAKLVKLKDGYQFFRLKKRKQNIKTPQYKYLEINNKGQACITLYNTTSGQYWPVQMPEPPKLQIVEDTSAKNWGVQELRRSNETYKATDTWWNKYGTFLMSAVLAATIIFAVIFFATKMTEISGNFAGAAKTFQDTVVISRGGTPTGMAPINITTPAPSTGIDIFGFKIG